MHTRLWRKMLNPSMGSNGLGLNISPAKDMPWNLGQGAELLCFFYQVKMMAPTSQGY